MQLLKMKKIYLLILIATAVSCAYYFQQNTQQIINWLHTLGYLAPVSFVTIYSIAATCFFPTLVLTLASGALFGPIVGALLSLLGATIGASISFLVSRGLIYDWLNKKKHRRFDALVHGVERHGWQFVALLRLLPIIPFALVNYGLGLTRIKFSHYVVATFIFLMPLEFASTYFSYKGLDLINHPYSLITTNSILFLLGSVLLILLVNYLIQRYKTGIGHNL